MAFDPILNLADLDGSNGFRIDGVAEFDQSGFSVSSAGDINGDGFDDLIIGARDADPNGNSSGSSYVVFGSGSGFTSTLNLFTLTGLNGFRIGGAAPLDRSGRSVSSVGDINGDGIDDLIVGADGADPNGSYSGSSYVVFGRRANEAPTIVTNSVVNVSENTTLVVDIEATDDSNSEGDGLTYSLSGGEDQTLFAIDTTTGELSFLSAPDFENPLDVGGDNGYAVEVTVTDAGGLSTAQLFNINVTDVNEAPTIVTNGVVTVPENTTLVVDIEATDDSSSEGNSLTYSLSGGADQTLFAIDVTTGELSFLSAPDFEQPLDVGNDNGYAVEVTVTDADGLSTAQLFNINVTDVNEGPINAPTPFDDILSGTAGDDTILALAGNDVVRGLGGDDRLFGQAGSDRLIGGVGDDVLNGGADTDRLFGQAGNDRLIGGTDDDLLDGGADTDRLFGQAGNDTLQGGDGNDILLGGTGNDRLDGGTGNDVMTTGGGRDIIVVRQNDGFDRVTDFQNNQDRIDLVGIQFGQLTIQQRQDDVLVKLGNTNLMLLENTNASVIDRADFM